MSQLLTHFIQFLKANSIHSILTCRSIFRFLELKINGLNWCFSSNIGPSHKKRKAVHVRGTRVAGWTVSVSEPQYESEESALLFRLQWQLYSWSSHVRLRCWNRLHLPWIHRLPSGTELSRVSCGVWTTIRMKISIKITLEFFKFNQQLL